MYSGPSFFASRLCSVAICPAVYSDINIGAVKPPPFPYPFDRYEAFAAGAICVMYGLNPGCASDDGGM